ncbi:kinase [Thraustotheca clavata]|uniref:Kinase n=1 Tax=Thraustotheca clavata TaxID=74557 RepID=A0A1V9ZGJ6_9STRA|nr:kinase [Thraustotheca clavata]
MERPRLQLPTTGTRPKTTLESSPHHIHHILKQDGVVRLIETWGKHTGYTCPYVAPPVSSPSKKKSPRKPRQWAPCHSLPSPNKPAWDFSTFTSTKSSASLDIILHNHQLAMTHAQQKLKQQPKFLAHIVLPPARCHGLYGLEWDTQMEQNLIASPQFDYRQHSSWQLRVHPLHGIGLIDPCRWRQPHPCSRRLHPYVEVVVGSLSPQRCSPSYSHGLSPLWSKSWLTFLLKASDAFPQYFDLRVYNVCGENELLLGAVTIPLNSTHGCDFFQLRNRRGKPTGRVKIMFLLEGLSKPEPPKSPLFQLKELQIAKTMLKKVEPPPTLIAPQPILRRTTADTSALLDRIKTIVEEQHQLRTFTPEELIKHQLVGEGLHATVYDINGTLALKEFRYEESRGVPPYSVVQAFQKELEIWLVIHHNNVIQLEGVQFTPHLGFITELMAGGSLFTCRSSPSWSSVNQTQKVYIALQIACALAYIHEINVLHRDIKLHNILLSETFKATHSAPIAKLCDFGSAILLRDGKINEPVGTSGYTAPEVFTGDGYSLPSDIWSFGILLWEILSPYPNPHPNPFTGIANDVFLHKVTNGERPHLDSSISLYTRLIEECWRLIPSERPTAADIVATLARLLQP